MEFIELLSSQFSHQPHVCLEKQMQDRLPSTAGIANWVLSESFFHLHFHFFNN